MSSEYRQITFSIKEISRAVVDLMKHNGVFPPLSRVAGLRITEVDGDIAGMLTVTSRDGSKVRDLPLTAEIFGAALIRLCRETGIPLPRTAKKRLVRTGDGLAMHLSLSAGETEISLDAPSVETPAEPKNVTKAAASKMPQWWVEAMGKKR